MTIARKGGLGRLSEVTLDGAMRKIPGYELGAKAGDRLPLLTVSSGLMALDAAAANVGPFLVPYDAEIIAASWRMIGTTLVTASTVLIGTNADNNKFETFTLPTGQAAGFAELPAGLTAFEAVNVDKGDVIEFGTGGEATASADIFVSVILAPRAS